MVFVIELEVKKQIEISKKKNQYSFFDLDHVYLETNKQAEPYSIACILDFRLVS